MPAQCSNMVCVFHKKKERIHKCFSTRATLPPWYDTFVPAEQSPCQCNFCDGIGPALREELFICDPLMVTFHYVDLTLTTRVLELVLVLYVQVTYMVAGGVLFFQLCNICCKYPLANNLPECALAQVLHCLHPRPSCDLLLNPWERSKKVCIVVTCLVGVLMNDPTVTPSVHIPWERTTKRKKPPLLCIILLLMSSPSMMFSVLSPLFVITEVSLHLIVVNGVVLPSVFLDIYQNLAVSKKKKKKSLHSTVHMHIDK